MKHRAGPYAILLALFVLAFAYQARLSVETVRDLLRPEEHAQAPFGIGQGRRAASAAPSVRFVRDKALAPDLLEGDVLLAVEGKPYVGASVLAAAVAARRPGDELRLRVRRGAEERDVVVRLTTEWRGPMQRSAAYTVWLDLVMPWFCLLVGFWVALARPEDRRAWLLLALMLSFAHIMWSPDLMSWEGWLRPEAVGFHSVWNSTWPLWIFLFGLYFPEPFDWERRHRALKWIVIVPFLVLAAASAVSSVGMSEDFRAAALVDPFLRPLRRWFMAINMVPVALFVLAVAVKWRTERSADSRRRLRLLLVGTVISMGPRFALAAHDLLRPPGRGPWMTPWMLPAFAMMFLFPVTLAYVIVVQRAMEIRVVLRQSVQYALARRSLWALRAILGALIIWWAVSLTGREQLNLFETILVGSIAAAAVIATTHLSERAAVWIDRRFFREAYNSEQSLSELGNEVRTMVEERTVLETVARRVSQSLHVPRVAILTQSNGHFAPAYAVGWESAPELALPAASATVEHLQQTREPAPVYFDDSSSWIQRLQENERRSLDALDSRLLVPLAVKDRLLGFISLGEKRSEAPYSRTDVRLLQSVATQVALALENSQLAAAIAEEAAHRERLNRELEIAREVQERLFPQKLPPTTGLDYAGLCRPAQGVGGDYYDFIALPGGQLGIAIGDVSGKGVSAALLMASLQASLRGRTHSRVGGLADLMRDLNQLIYDSTPSNRFASFFYAEYDPVLKRLTYVNAGHNAPMLFRDGEVMRLDAGGMVLGCIPSAAYVEQTVELAPGDRIVAFTDGISEALNESEEEWGEPRLVATVAAEPPALPAKDLIDRILAAVDGFVAGTPQFDDLTLVVLRVLPQ
jgi:sigma-B regulation protein RsbU (phosphoserine phosphatase)